VDERKAAASRRTPKGSEILSDKVGTFGVVMLLGQESFVGFLVNNNRPPLPPFFISVDFKGTLSCFRINTCISVDSKGDYGRYYRT
jgi:hypothetical protein